MVGRHRCCCFCRNSAVVTFLLELRARLPEPHLLGKSLRGRLEDRWWQYRLRQRLYTVKVNNRPHPSGWRVQPVNMQQQAEESLELK